ncbi:MAG TPA: GntR family transcriptional regulator [Acidimicrobiales bacterium]|nr:GntR family transcriptional regulator [Acidimicrobiales bacterium]
MRELRYKSIAEDLRERIGSGEFTAGHLLPSEAELGRAYDASRVTVRKALESLRDDGVADARQGYGWFVVGDPVRQTLGRLATIEGQLADHGVHAERHVLDFGFVRSPRRVRDVLGVDDVLRVRRLNRANGEPFAVVTVWVPERLGAKLSRDAVERSPIYELLPVKLGGATQTIGAAAATERDAGLLEVPAGAPLLRCERTTYDTRRRPVLFSEHLFPALRTEFVVDLPADGVESFAPAGLRLVD